MSAINWYQSMSCKKNLDMNKKIKRSKKNKKKSNKVKSYMYI